MQGIIETIQLWTIGPTGAEYLIGLALKTAVVLAMAAVVTTALRRTTPGLRHLALQIAVLGVLALPLLALMAPSWSSPTVGGLPVLVPAESSPGVAPDNVTGAIESPLVQWWFWVPVLWLLGTSLTAARFAYSMLLAHRVVAAASPVNLTSANRLLDTCAADLGLRRTVRLLRSGRVAAPFAWGLLHPVIVLPLEASRWSREQLRMVLLHELAHVRRLDIVWVTLGNIAAAVYWFNPLVWIVRHRSIIASELACDDLVLTGGARASDYAQHLLTIARDLSRKSNPSPAGLTMAHTSHLEGRLMSILSTRKRSARLEPVRTICLALLATALILPLAGAQIWARPSVGVPSGQADNEKTADEKLPAPEDFVEMTTPPEMILQSVPKYPDEAKEKEIEGIVWVRALIDKEGKVRDAQVAKSSGHEILDKEALRAAHLCNYIPGKKDDRPVAVWVTYKIEFTLDNK